MEEDIIFRNVRELLEEIYKDYKSKKFWEKLYEIIENDHIKKEISKYRKKNFDRVNLDDLEEFIGSLFVKEIVKIYARILRLNKRIKKCEKIFMDIIETNIFENDLEKLSSLYDQLFSLYKSMNWNIFIKNVNKLNEESLKIEKNIYKKYRFCLLLRNIYNETKEEERRKILRMLKRKYSLKELEETKLKKIVINIYKEYFLRKLRKVIEERNILEDEAKKKLKEEYIDLKPMFDEIDKLISYIKKKISNNSFKSFSKTIEKIEELNRKLNNLLKEY